MDVRILDLDGSIPVQEEFVAQHHTRVLAVRDWGPLIRLACSHRRFCQFERAIDPFLSSIDTSTPGVTLYGSGDFHHVSLALVRRLQSPVNLLVLDNHPDWMRGVPFLHCGTWLYHAARLPMVRRIFHVGGNVDFDNYYQRLGPWSLLRSGKIVVFPGVRAFTRGAWRSVPNWPLRTQPEERIPSNRIAEVLFPFRAELASLPLYVSLDKDVLIAEDAPVNWDSGHLTLPEVCQLLEEFVLAANGNLAGMDIVGDFSAVQVRGWLRHLMHLTMHPALDVDPAHASRRNAQTNGALVAKVEDILATGEGRSAINDPTSTKRCARQFL